MKFSKTKVQTIQEAEKGLSPGMRRMLDETIASYLLLDKRAKEKGLSSLQRVEQMVVYANEVIKDLWKGRPYRPDCKPGCHACCSIYVQGADFEGEAAAEYAIQQYGSGYAKLVLAQLEEYEKQDEGKTLQQLRDTVRNCVFLERGQCAIYPVRPASCVAHHSLDVNMCKPGTKLLVPKFIEVHMVPSALIGAVVVSEVASTEEIPQRISGMISFWIRGLRKVLKLT